MAIQAGTSSKEYPRNDITKFVRVAGVNRFIRKKEEYNVAIGMKKERIFVKTNKKSREYLMIIENTEFSGIFGFLIFMITF